MRFLFRLITVGALTLGLAVGAAAWSATAQAAGSSSSSKSSSGDRAAKRYAKAVKEIKKGDFDDAIDLLRKVVKKQPDNADAHNLLGFSYRKLGKFDPARKHYARALEINPKHKGALEYLGELHLQTGDLKGAEALLARLAAACPGGCEEREDLTVKIAAYRKKAGS